MNEQTVFLIDDEECARDGLAFALRANGYHVRTFGDAEQFLKDAQDKEGCLITDIELPGMNGLALVKEISARGLPLAVVVVTGHAAISRAVDAIGSGAVDFLEKPVSGATLAASVRRALELSQAKAAQAAAGRRAQEVLARLTPRERDVLAGMIQSRPTKLIARDLGISPRTVEVHRANVQRKTKCFSLAELMQLPLEALRGLDAQPMPSQCAPALAMK